MSSFLLTVSGLILTTESGQEFLLENQGASESIQFISKTQGGTSWLWEFGDGDTSTEENPRHLYPASGAWVATLTTFSDAGQQASIQRAVVVYPCTPVPDYPLLVVAVNDTQLGYGGFYDNLVFFGESVNNPTAVVIENLGTADLVINSITIPYEASNPINPNWYNFTPPAYPLTIPAGGSYAFTVFSTPGVGVNQLGQALGHLTIASNDFVHPHWVGNLYAQCRWYAEFYTTVPDMLIGGVPYFLQTVSSWSLGTRVTVLSDGVFPPYAVGQCPPCSGDMVFHIQMSTLIAPPARVDLGTINLQDVVGTWSLTPQTFDYLDGLNTPQVMDITCTRPVIRAFNKAQFIVPSNVRQDGAPWTLNLYCDWRVAVSTEWYIVSLGAISPPIVPDGSTAYWFNGSIVAVTVPSGAPWGCTALIQSDFGPVHPDTTTIVFTPTHTVPGSTGSWVFATASMGVDSDIAPTLYSYPFRIFAPFLANNVVPQTADLTVTIRKNDCTTETRTVHLQFFDSGVAPSTPVIESRTVVCVGSSGNVESGTALGPGPTPVLVSPQSPFGIAPGCTFVNAYGGDIVTSFQITLTVSGTAPITYQWQHTLDGITWTPLTEGSFFLGTTTNSLSAGGATPGVAADLGDQRFRCVVTNPAGSTICEPIPTVTQCDG